MVRSYKDSELLTRADQTQGFDGFAYGVTWEDEDINIFVANEMNKHEV